MNTEIQRVRQGLPVPTDTSLWYSTTGEAVRITDTTGNVVIVPPYTQKPRTLERRFWALAMKQGCAFVSGDDPISQVMPESDGGGGGFAPPDVDAENNARYRAITDAMMDILRKGDYEAMTSDEKPKTDALTMRCGFRVTAEERDALWQGAIQQWEQETASGGPQQ